MVESFLRERGVHVDLSVDLVARQRTLAAAAKAAIFALHPEYKKHDHQFRISEDAMRDTWQRRTSAVKI